MIYHNNNKYLIWYIRIIFLILWYVEDIQDISKNYINHMVNQIHMERRGSAGRTSKRHIKRIKKINI